MKKTRRYEIIIWIVLSVLTGFLAYSSILDSKRPIDQYSQKTGKIFQIGICEYQTTAIIKGFPERIKSKILCFNLDNEIRFKIFKTNRSYESILNQINKGDTISVRFKNNIDREDGRYTAIEISNKNQTIYSVKQWKSQLRIEILSFTIAALIFFVAGFVRHHEFLKSKSS